MKAECTSPNCSREVLSREMCSLHYQRWRKQADPSEVLSRDPAAKIAWIMRAAFTYDQHAIWPWATDSHGYAKIKMDGKTRGVHAMVCELAHGPAPQGTECCHSISCTDRNCCAAGCLRWDTHRENVLDMGRLA